MAKKPRLLITVTIDEKQEMKIQQARNGDASLAAYLRRLAREDANNQYSTIKNEDIYNKLVDLGLSIIEIKEVLSNKNG